ncbi:hypothetical protein BDB00DRAFT_746268, partial [Zychaea mexicana]|uniref:uncharacterized protein n=1 Tax=Zychaea mexicana TaxID=64656 RepID=UPI0022FF2DCB
KMTIFDDLSLDSYHKMIQFSYETDRLTTRDSTQQTANHRRLWRLSKLADADFRRTYTRTFAQQLQPLNNDLQNCIKRATHQTSQRIELPTIIDDISDRFYDTLYETLDTTLGATTGGRQASTEFWTVELQRLVEYRELCYRKWRRAYGMNKLTWWLKHQQADARARRAMTKRSRQTWRTFCSRLETEEYSKRTAIIKKIRHRRTVQPTFSHQDGPQQAANLMAQHLTSVYDGHLIINDHTRSTSNNHTTSTPTTVDCPITPAVVALAIERLPSRKAPGIDHVRSEMLKPIAATLAPFLCHLFQLCWMGSYTPEAWRVAQVLPIYKKGTPDDPANFRPISLTSVLRKILEYCL